MIKTLSFEMYCLRFGYRYCNVSNYILNVQMFYLVLKVSSFQVDYDAVNIISTKLKLFEL